MPDHSKTQSKSYITRFFQHPLFFIGYTVTAITCAALIYEANKYLGGDHVIYGLIAAAVLVFSIAGLTLMLGRLKQEEILDDRIAHMQQLVVNHDLHWVVNQHDIRLMSLDSDETWVFANELTYTLEPGTALFNGMRNSITRGARHKFFMPDRPRVHKIVADFKRLHKFAPGQIEFILIPQSEFLFHTIISVFNVHTENIRAIETVANRDIDAWVEMDRDHAGLMAGIGETLIRKYADRYTPQHSTATTPAANAT